MATPQHLPPPAELNEDATAEILLRIPPDEPAHLIRASAVSKLWLRIASDPAFLHRYRAFHRGAPLLGFFYNQDVPGPFPGFLPTTAAPSPPQPGHAARPRIRRIYDCRHGRVILTEIGHDKFVVWDPFSDYWEELWAPDTRWAFHPKVVLCAVAGCNHQSCRAGGPFFVVCVGIDRSAYTAHARVYSSESRAWGGWASAQLLDNKDYTLDTKRAALVGDGIYCTLRYGTKILKYDLVERRLSLIGMPAQLDKANPVLMQNEDASLGIAAVLGSTLYLWSTMVTAEGVTGWVQRRVTELKEMLPVDIISGQVNVTGFAEGVEVFFISTNAGAFTVELKSGRVRKIGEPSGYHGVTPLISFFTPDRGSSKWTK